MACILKTELNDLCVAFGREPGTEQTVGVPCGCSWDNLSLELGEDPLFKRLFLLSLEGMGTLGGFALEAEHRGSLADLFDVPLHGSTTWNNSYQANCFKYCTASLSLCPQGDFF